ncbi:hypothetical protein ANN_02317 [Periplaneta americana]|uniref:Reverse transcriptase domain-containing protein n=1 Tax=Periplaneta americana TaxID=6978 RepID=A0ABQ8TW14_PERAM|nr:hypothetical protein ANN_02317 [Periplaneta americana]
MIGLRIEENMNSEIIVFKTGGSDRKIAPRAKRKLYSEELESMDNKDGNACAKRRNTEENECNLNNGGLQTRLEVVVVNGKWDTSQTIPSIIAEMHSVDLQDLDVVNEFCVPWSESSGTEISIEDENSIFKQCSQRATFMESDLEFSTDSHSTSGESTPFTMSDTDSRRTNDSENNCDENLSWLINFKVDSLFNADEIGHDHNYQGREKEGSVCEGDYKVQRSEICMGTHGVKRTKNSARCGRLFLSDSNVNVRKLQTTQQQKPNHANRYSGPKKPPFTYTELIEQALQENGELTVSGIYHWISYVYVDDVNMLEENPQTIRENTAILLEASNEIGLEVNSEKKNNVYDYVS